MVTGLLNGSSSMIPLFFKSRGVGFAVRNRKNSFHTSDNADSFTNSYNKTKSKSLSCRAVTSGSQKLTFPVGFQVAVDGRGGDIT